MPSSIITEICLSLAVIGCIYGIKHLIVRRKGELPGPGGIPIIGNVLQNPKGQEWLQYTAWSKQYGRYLHETQTFLFSYWYYRGNLQVQVIPTNSGGHKLSQSCNRSSREKVNNIQ